MEIPSEVQPEDFETMFKARLGENWERVRTIADNYGEYHTRSLAYVYDLALEEGRVERLTEVLEMGWNELFAYIPDPIATHVEIMRYFDSVYVEVFGDVLARRLGLDKLPIASPPGESP